ncbi:MAG: D-glucuronyl C5-epimerase family protein [Bacteroidales bacterium]|nr:D-glucuronyl C5-epimerase family protein [Bacteroidales bacterium]
MSNPDNYKYYYPFEEVFADISDVSWMQYDEQGVVTNIKERLKDQYKISRASLYKSDNSEYYYHPAAIAQCALGSFNLINNYQEGNYKKTFLSNITWLLDNGILYNNCLVYPFPFGLPDFHPEPMWVSGMYQGQVLSALVRAYLLTEDKSIYSACEKIFNSFFIKLGEKYGFRDEKNNELWFEEAPQKPPKHILNGEIYAIWGIYDFMHINDDPLLKEQWQKSIITIEKNIHRYDNGFWSYYDLTGNLASYYYHKKVHITQLDQLYQQTSIEVFKRYSDKWLRYSNSLKSKTLKKLLSTYNRITRKRHRYNTRNN